MAQMTESTSSDSIVDLEAIAKRLCGLRSRTALSQRATAEASGIPLRTLQSWEEAKRQTGRKSYERIAAYYSETLGEVIPWEWIVYNRVPGVDLDQLRLEWTEQIRIEVAAMRETLRPEIRAELEAEMGTAA